MTFLAPAHLWALLVIGIIVSAYVVAEARRRRLVHDVVDSELLTTLAPRRPGWRRTAAITGLVLTLLAVVLAWARPARSLHETRRVTTVMAAIDVSSSMEAEDVKPTRLVAAKSAASEFVLSLPSRLRIGLIVFSDAATISVQPTDDHHAVVTAIQDAKADGGTAIGEAVFRALDALSAEHGLAPPVGVDGVYQRIPASAIVLLSDGATNAGRSNATAVAAARDAGVPVSTIAFGTDHGVLKIDDSKLEVPVDAKALESIAKSTAGHFYRAASNAELQAVYADVGSEVVSSTRHRVITGWFIGAAVVLAGLTGTLSVAWFGRLAA